MIAFGILAAQIPSSAAQDKDALKFVRTAADVAINLQPDSIDGYLAIYVGPQNWHAASADSDLGPFIQAQEANPSRSLVCLFSATRSTAVCVYFDGARAYGTALKSKQNNSFTAADAAASYGSITRELLRKPPGTIDFSPTNVNLDNGQELDAYSIKQSAH